MATIMDTTMAVREYLDRRGQKAVVELVQLREWLGKQQSSAQPYRPGLSYYSLPATLARLIRVEEADLLVWIDAFVNRVDYWYQICEEYDVAIEEVR